MNEGSDTKSVGFDMRDLRNAFGMFATGVTIVTTCTPEGRPVGLTCNSFASVSLQPPLVLWSLSLYSPNLQVFLQAPRFAVNILACDQFELSRRFSSPVRDRFEGVSWASGEGGVPLIPGVAAHIECRNETRHYSGDHVILIGQVVRYAYRDVEPLIFSRGLYRSLGACLTGDGSC
ncbi:MAG: flavin reductase [Betaproteobacteria bacterium]|nr:flavin reductase [Betaproteobacteria bacterium]